MLLGYYSILLVRNYIARAAFVKFASEIHAPLSYHSYA